jgi:hypothetical protein
MPYGRSFFFRRPSETVGFRLRNLNCVISVILFVTFLDSMMFSQARRQLKIQIDQGVAAAWMPPFSVFYPKEAIDKKWPEYELKVAASEGRFEDEGWRVRKDGSLFWANVIITPWKDSAGNPAGCR